MIVRSCPGVGVALRRIGSPDEVAELIATITGAGFLTGSVYEIDGGSHLFTQ